jgi:DNA-binding CsgD family transcriptional regulator
MNIPRHVFPVATAERKIFDWTERPGEDLIGDTEWDAIKAYARLSRREGQVCRLLFEGQKRDRIAELLGISPRTVRYHLETLHKKLRVNTRVGLVLRMVQIQKFLKSESPNSRVL